ncbi:hypothetical protein Tco_1303551 [Tanacetum coccineum]
MTMTISFTKNSHRLLDHLRRYNRIDFVLNYEGLKELTCLRNLKDLVEVPAAILGSMEVYVGRRVTGGSGRTGPDAVEEYLKKEDATKNEALKKTKYTSTLSLGFLVTGTEQLWYYAFDESDNHSICVLTQSKSKAQSIFLVKDFPGILLAEEV